MAEQNMIEWTPLLVAHVVDYDWGDSDDLLEEAELVWDSEYCDGYYCEDELFEEIKKYFKPWRHLLTHLIYRRHLAVVGLRSAEHNFREAAVRYAIASIDDTVSVAAWDVANAQVREAYEVYCEAQVDPDLAAVYLTDEDVGYVRDRMDTDARSPCAGVWLGQ